MKKSLSVLAVLVAAAALPSVSACTVTDTPRPAEPLFDAFEAATLADDPVLIKADSGLTRIRWRSVEGAESYVLYRAESKYGAYTQVGTFTPDTSEYETAMYIYDYYKVCAVVNGEEVEVGEPQSAFSANALVISPDDDMTAVQSEIDRTHTALELGSTGQFSSQRAAYLFLPGRYDDLTAKIGYYTSVNGLGEVPTDVSVSLYVSDKVLDKQNATCTFWRSVENLTAKGGVVWAVSQATSFRRSKVSGGIALSYGGWSSGGFLANTLVTGEVSGGTQQQWMFRNDEARSYKGGSFNMVFSGCEGDKDSDVWTNDSGSVTVIDETERIAEKPFLYLSEQDYQVFLPSVQENTQGVTWKNGLAAEDGISVPLTEFYIADARYDDDVSLNDALAAGRNLLFTPGIYTLNAPLEVTNADTILFGLGYATLKISDSNTDCAVRVGDVDGVRIADLLLDAGKKSENMIVVGEKGSKVSHAEDPIVLSNLYCRIGGVANIHTETNEAVVIHANDVIGDNFWIWRADHSQGVAWSDEVYDNYTNYGNPAQTGVRVTGDRVHCYALMVEHFENFQTVWTGEDGLTVMYQSETPYRTPAQSDWMSHDGQKRGCASYKVEDSVSRHRAFGIGVYLVQPTGMTLDSAIEVPEKEGIEMRHLITCNFSGQNGNIMNVVNDYGGAVGKGAAGQRRVPRYPLAT